MPELLLELLSEEIPARMQARAAEDLKRLVTKGLDDAGLAYGSARAFATPRRLALVVDGIPARQPDKTEERKGPRVGAPEKAIAGFLKSAGLESLDQCEIREVKGNEFYFVVSEKKGGSTASVLVDALAGVVWSLPWPKSMRWPQAQGGYVRPLHNILLMFDGEPVKLMEGVRTEGGSSIPVNNKTLGHRFLAPESITVKDFADYEAKLRQAKVILDAAERKAIIAERAVALAAEEGLTVKDDPALLDEVAGLVEWPEVLIGRIDDEFMLVPAEVLITSMRSHQKYFSLLDKAGDLASRFIVVANTEAGTKAKQATIVSGNERVLRARLSDAKFFWDLDRKETLSSRIPALNDIIFHEKLGSLGDKVDRVGALAAELAPFIPGADKDKVRSAARLAKADLLTGMVGEFPELQGVMGRYYALHDNESEEVGLAVAEHYSPLGPNDSCPTAPVSVAVALADKIDTLVGFFAIGETPTGSRDPFALRRAALGVIRLVVENGLRLPLRQVFSRAHSKFVKRKVQGTLNVAFAATGDELFDQLMVFFADRLKVHLREKGVRHDFIDAVFGVGGQDDIVRLLARVDALSRFVETNDGSNLLTAYRRSANIVRIESEKNKATVGPSVDENLFGSEREWELWNALESADQLVRNAIDSEDFAGAMAALAALRAPVDNFFDAVTVNADEPEIRLNRLKLLRNIRMTMDVVADFSQIEG